MDTCEILNKLSSIFLQHCVENVPLWEDLCTGLGISAIRAADLHLKEMGYQTEYSPLNMEIRGIGPAHTPATFSVMVARAGSVRLCVHVPKDLVQKILVLEFVPKITAEGQC